jgi:hypothetical protein
MRVTNAILVYYTWSVRKIWWFSIRDLSGIISVRKVFLRALLMFLGRLQSPWGPGWQNSAPSLWKHISKNNDSVVMTQRIFRRHFDINPNDSAASLITLLLWMRYVGETASAAKTKYPGRQPTFRNPQNTGLVSQAVVRNPRRSIKQNFLELRMPDPTVRLIFHQYLDFRPSNIKRTRHCKSKNSLWGFF